MKMTKFQMWELEPLKKHLIDYNESKQNEKKQKFENINYKTDKTNCTYLFFDFGALSFEINDHFMSFITLRHGLGYNYNQIYNSLGLCLKDPETAINYIIENYEKMKNILEGIQ